MLAVAAVVTPAGVLFFGFDLSAAPVHVRGGDDAEHHRLRRRRHAVHRDGQLDATAGRLAGDDGLPHHAAAGGRLDANDDPNVSATGCAGTHSASASSSRLMLIFLAVSWLVFEWVLEP